MTIFLFPSAAQRRAWAGLVLLSMAAATAGAQTRADAPETSITASALFKDQALLIIDGKQRLLKAGQTSPEGVMLISADSQKAVVEWNGESLTVPLGNKIRSGFKKRQARSIQISPSEGGHYLISGSINGLATEFLVDTGATYISLSGNEAKRLGLEYADGETGYTSTASGLAKAYQINLNRVRIGDIEQKNIKAVVLEGAFPEIILLGNSFLSQLSIKREGAILEISER